MHLRITISYATFTYLILLCTSPFPALFRVLLTAVKYCGLITEVIGNIGLPCTTLEVRIVLAVSTFLFGLLEGGISYWKYRDRQPLDGKSQFETEVL